MKGATDRQVAVLKAIHDHVEGHGYPPTIAEMREALEIRSNRGVTTHLDALERKNFLQRDMGKARSLRITEAGLEVLRN